MYHPQHWLTHSRYLSFVLIICNLILCSTLLTGCELELDEAITTLRDQSGARDVASADRDSTNSVNYLETADSGPTRIIGEVAYTSPYFYLDNPDPYITLYNIAPFYGEQEMLTYGWIREAQQLGLVTSDTSVSPFTYQLLLPAQPSGPYADLNFDDEADVGIGVYTINLVSNVSGDPFLDFAYGDSLSSMSSVEWGHNEEYGDTLIGGSIVVYSPDADQTFSTSFGADGVLFTEDDPQTILPQGYTIVTLQDDTFEFSHAATTTVDFFEPSEVARIDHTEQTYTEAFDELLALLDKRYAYTEHYNIDWRGLDSRWRERIAEAESAEDYDAYITTLYDFVRTFGDGHISIEFDEFPALVDQYDGSVGIVVQETDRDSTYITAIIPNLPADQAGIKPGAELLAIDGVAPSEAIAATDPYYPSGVPSERHWRLAQMMYVERGDVGSTTTLRYRNPDQTGEQVATLTRVYDWNGPSWPRFYAPDMPARPLPLEFDILPNGHGHIKFYSFFDDIELTLDLWDRAINTLNHEEIPGVVVDMRNNEGGRLWLAELTASYFFDKNVALGAFTYYDPDNDEFLYDPESQRIMYPIPSELHYAGKIVVLIGPDCASACEFFSYALDQKEETQILGYYPSAGLGGSVESVYMPDGVIFNFTIGRAVDAEGEIHIEGMGIQPDINVPITREAVLSQGDALLRAAEIALDFAIDRE